MYKLECLIKGYRGELPNRFIIESDRIPVVGEDFLIEKAEYRVERVVSRVSKKNSMIYGREVYSICSDKILIDLERS
jgi:hypothetical protein